MYSSVEDLNDMEWVMLLSLLGKAWMEIVRTLGSLLEASSLFGIFAASLQHIILVPVIGH
jgi:hypothetical protein